MDVWRRGVKTTKRGGPYLNQENNQCTRGWLTQNHQWYVASLDLIFLIVADKLLCKVHYYNITLCGPFRSSTPTVLSGGRSRAIYFLSCFWAEAARVPSHTRQHGGTCLGSFLEPIEAFSYPFIGPSGRLGQFMNESLSNIQHLEKNNWQKYVQHILCYILWQGACNTFYFKVLFFFVQYSKRIVSYQVNIFRLIMLMMQHCYGKYFSALRPKKAKGDPNIYRRTAELSRTNCIGP